MENRPHHIQNPTVSAGENYNTPVGESPALWHRAKEVDPNVGWHATRINVRRIWNTFEDRCHGVVNSSKRDLARLAHWFRR